MGRVACETLVTTGLVIVAGEITTTTYVDIPKVVRSTIREVGYTRAKYGFDCDTCGIIASIDEQSTDIAQGVDHALEERTGELDDEELDKEGAGDQGMMFGYQKYSPIFDLMVKVKLLCNMRMVNRKELIPY